MKTNLVKLLTVASVVLSLAVFFGIGYFYDSKNDFINIGGEEFEVEVADTPEKRASGLSGRDRLCRNCAMLFIFREKGAYEFWMKDMKFDIDMIWIDGDEILQIDENVPYADGLDEKRSSGAPADKVLEINAGESGRLGLRAGDRINGIK